MDFTKFLDSHKIVPLSQVLVGVLLPVIDLSVAVRMFYTLP